MKDRSELANLYPEVGSVTRNTRKNTLNIQPIVNGHKITFIHILSIATFFTISIVMFVLFSNFLNQTVDTNNTVNLISAIAMSFIPWVLLLIFVLVSVSKSLKNIGISRVLFLAIYSMSTLPVSQVIYNLYNYFNHGTVDIIPLAAMLFVENFIFVSFILTLMNTEKLSEKPKTILLVFMITLCILAIFVSNNYK